MGPFNLKNLTFNLHKNFRRLISKIERFIFSCFDPNNEDISDSLVYRDIMRNGMKSTISISCSICEDTLSTVDTIEEGPEMINGQLALGAVCAGTESHLPNRSYCFHRHKRNIIAVTEICRSRAFGRPGDTEQLGLSWRGISHLQEERRCCPGRRYDRGGWRNQGAE